ncbi:MAG: hypothetical protein AAF804_10450, partial [Bacteroidota bacterium]
KQLNLNSSQKSAISFLLSEITDNITDHAQTERGFVFIQYFRKKGFMDIVIADLGITIKTGYRQVGIEAESHHEALDKALNGISSKEDSLRRGERGFGLDISHNIVLDGLGGKGRFYLISGNGMVVDRKEGIEFEERFAWPGTLILIRIPSIPHDFRISEFTSI